MSVVGFTVGIIDNKNRLEIDVDWETWTGGGETTSCDVVDPFATVSPGHKSVGEITLRGAMTNKRAALCAWINDTAAGKKDTRTLVITDRVLEKDGTVRDGQQRWFIDCQIVRYVFPEIGRCRLVEEITVKPIRVKLL